MAARQLGLERVPAVIAELSDAQAARVAVNLNTVHGQPPATLLAPFLASIEPAALSAVHIPEPLRSEVRNMDEVLGRCLAARRAPAAWNRQSPRSRVPGQSATAPARPVQ